MKVSEAAQKETLPVLIEHADAADMIGVSTRKLLRWALNGCDGFPAPVRRVERTYLFNRQDLLKWAKVQPRG